MNDYIEREKARKAVWQILNGMGYSEKHNDRLVEEVDAILDDIPAADVVPGRDYRDCRNELCLRCGGYKQRHLGGTWVLAMDADGGKYDDRLHQPRGGNQAV